MFRSTPFLWLTHSLLALVFLLGQAAPSGAQRFFQQTRNSSNVISAFRTVVATPSESTVRVLCDDAPAALGTVVEIARRGKGGSLRIAFTSEQELQRLFDLLLRGGRR